MSRPAEIHHYIEAFSKLPPYITGPLAIASFFGLHMIAGQPLPDTTAINDPASQMHLSSTGLDHVLTLTIIHALAMVFQYIVPFILVCSILLWAVRNRDRKRIKQMAHDAITPESMNGLTWEDFEKTVAQGFVRIGFRAQMTCEGADGGVDIVLTKGDAKYLVQCKHWRDKQIAVSTVREMYGVLTADAAASGIYIVTSGTFSPEAIAFASDKPIWLYNGEKLRGLLKTGKTAVGGEGKLILERLATPAGGSPSCPTCRSPMTMRKARRGSHAGKPFWGCNRHPVCSGIIPIDN